MDIISFFIVVIIPIAIFYYVLSKAESIILTPEENGSFTTSLNKIYEFLGVTTMAIGFAFPLLIMYYNTVKTTEIIIMIVLFLLFFGSGLFLYFFYRNYIVILDNEYITTRNTFRKENRLKWDQITTISQDSFRNKITLKSKSESENMMISMHVVGIFFVISKILEETALSKDNVQLSLKYLKN